MKKIIIAVIIGIILTSFCIPVIQTFAQDTTCVEAQAGRTSTSKSCQPGQRLSECCPTKGLVVCGTPCCRCRFCDFFRLLDKIIDFAMFKLAPVAAVLLIIVGGIMFLVSSGDPSMVTRAKKIIFSVIIGLAIMYSAYMIVGFILNTIGLSSWTKDMYSSWLNQGIFTINCGDDSSSSP